MHMRRWHPAEPSDVCHHLTAVFHSWGGGRGGPACIVHTAAAAAVAFSPSRLSGLDGDLVARMGQTARRRTEGESDHTHTLSHMRRMGELLSVLPYGCTCGDPGGKRLAWPGLRPRPWQKSMRRAGRPPSLAPSAAILCHFRENLDHRHHGRMNRALFVPR